VAEPNTRHSAAASEARFIGGLPFMDIVIEMVKKASCQCLPPRYVGKRTLSVAALIMQKR
jgi:hypothetical protein